MSWDSLHGLWEFPIIIYIHIEYHRINIRSDNPWTNQHIIHQLCIYIYIYAIPMCPPVIKHGDGKSPSKDHVSKQPVVSVDFPASHGWWHRRVAPSCPNSSLTNHHSPVISIYFWWFKTSIDDGDQQGRFSPSCQRPHLSPVSASPQKLNDYWSPNVWVHRHFWAKPKINIAGYKYIYIYI